MAFMQSVSIRERGRGKSEDSDPQKILRKLCRSQNFSSTSIA